MSQDGDGTEDDNGSGASEEEEEDDEDGFNEEELEMLYGDDFDEEGLGSSDE